MWESPSLVQAVPLWRPLSPLTPSLGLVFVGLLVMRVRSNWRHVIEPAIALGLLSYAIGFFTLSTLLHPWKLLVGVLIGLIIGVWRGRGPAPAL